MKFGLVLLPLLAAAALAVTSETRWDVRELLSEESAPTDRRLSIAPPWLSSEAELPVLDSSSSHDPHAGPFAAHDSLASHNPHTGYDPHTELYHASAPHPLPRPGSVPAVERSTAAHGRTVAETFAERVALNGKQVRLRATVIKITEGILGKTYLHLQDGTGSPEQHNHDLTATTTEAFELGETVEVEGQLAIDRDVGLGYEYAALLTQATRVDPP